MDSCRYLSKRLMGPLSAELEVTTVSKVIHNGLHEYLGSL